MKNTDGVRPAESRLFVQSLQKGLALLEAFAVQPGELTLNELAARAGMDRSTAQRMAHTLQALGYLERGANGRGYRLGKKVLDRSFDFLRSNSLVQRAMPLLVEVQKSSGERVDLSLFDDLSIIYVARRPSKRETFFATLIGRRMPTFSSSGGRAVMAYLGAAEVDSILSRSALTPATPKTIVEPKLILEEIARARQNGFALAQEESILGEVVLASAVLDHRGRPVAAIHIAGSLAEWEAGQFARRCAPLAIEAAQALSHSASL
jgi:IclR family transcriptional regulator, pca regulon regulatory protein